jgi:O-acetyl-ADP-ribose deacetylase (regulator of RNase III)
MTSNEELVESLIGMLLDEMPGYREEATKASVTPRRLLRGLMNVRPPMPLGGKYVLLQDELLSREAMERGVVRVEALPRCPKDERISLWQGDITRLDADVIVNAANSALLGCFVPCHGCIDNAIHSAAGLQLRDECARIMADQGHDEPTGRAKMTRGYNLPAAHVIHTVGPIVPTREPTRDDARLLASCYESCLDIARERSLHSIVFCCVSTGEFGYPNEPAARVACETVRAWLDRTGYPIHVVFDVFKEVDRHVYERLLG